MKVKTKYVCKECGQTSSKWLGRCTSCESWNSFQEETTSPSTPELQEGSLSSVREDFKTMRDLVPVGQEGEIANYVFLDAPESEEKKETTSRRLPTGMEELDRVLGGGLVADSFVLLGGDPGIGKSTLLLQMARGMTEKNESIRLLYVSGEESIDQIRSRAKRLGVAGKGKIFLAGETNLERVFSTVKELKPNVLVMDSLQTFSSGFVQSAPGSVSQVREVAARLMMLAKTAGIAVWLVGHVTKEGSIAGPKTVEHMVDTVLYFEGEGGQSYRLLRTVKNRFGSTRELGVFEMDGEGLREVTNPSSLFLSEREEPVSGTAIAASLEGSRPILVELQALVVPSGLSMPRRTAVGIESARLSLLSAILERHMKLNLSQLDLFFNVAGGLKLSEPACDLAAAAAIWASFEEKCIPVDWVFLGELGLTGEVRRVTQMDVRVGEAKKLGFKTIVVPKQSLKSGSLGKFEESGIKLIPISRVEELIQLLEG